MVQATTGAANEVRSKVIADVYMKTNAEQADLDRVQKLIETQVPHVGKVQFVSKKQALARRARGRPRRLLRPARLQPAARHLPHHARTTRTTSARSATRSPRARPSGGRSVVDPAIDEVRNREEDTAKILSVTRVVKLTMALLAVLLVIASMLLIANTIRLSLYARRREVEVMKLVGATDWFIRWPFVLEGVMVGALGGVLAVLLLGVVKVAVVDPLAADFALIAAPETMNFPLLIALLLVRLGRRLGARLGHLAAPLPARLAGFSSLAVPWAAAPCVVLSRSSCSCRSCSSRVSGSAATLACCPEFVRDKLVDDGDAQVYEEAVDIIQRDYYRECRPRPAARQVARRGRQVARRPVLQLLLARGLRGLPGGHAGAVLGRRHDRRGDQAAACG